MAFLTTLLQRFGLFTPKPELDEAFDRRLTRLNHREARRSVRSSVFVRNPV